MNILGINAFHGDSSAAIVCDGQLIAAIEEERFNRVKHWAGFPAESIRYCLETAGVQAGQLDHVAVSFNPRANLGRKVLFALKNRPSLANIMDRLQHQGKSRVLMDHLASALDVEPDAISAKVHNVEHHDAHIACGFYLSPYSDAAILSVDGMGDFVSTVTATGNDLEFNRLNQVYYPHSLGYLYNAVTIYLGFPHYGDEYKVMGLAPYGEPKYVEQFRQIVYPKGKTFELNLDYFTHPKNGISMSWEDGSPHVDAFHSPKLEELLGPVRKKEEPVEKIHEDIAASMQVVTEEIIFHILNELHQETGKDNLVVVGGCAMNSVANGKILSETPFNKLYVPAGAADNGTSFGAAFYVWHKTLQQPRSFQLVHSSWGDDTPRSLCLAASEESGLPFEELDDSELYDRVLDAICDGKVVGWFRGKMEFGSRALGNRSIIADPRRTDMRDIINSKIKFREKFRPFAPSILEEYVSDYFAINEPSPFMERVLPIRAEKRAEIPAVTHVDGSGRLQTVSRETSPEYWELIDRFRQRTGVPILLNTSLNENEPIVRTPAEAVNCFLRTSMDMLVVGNCVIEREHEKFSLKKAG